MLSQYGVITIARNASTNALTPDTAGNCIAYPQSSFAGCTALPGVCCSAFYPARDIVGTKDGKNVYIATESPNSGIWGLNRNGGSISLKPPPLQCLSAPATDPCSTFRQGNRLQAVAASADSRNVYGGGNSRIWVFGIDRPPVCQSVSAGTVNTAAVTVTLSCSDADGDAITYEKVPGTGPSVAHSRTSRATP